MPKRNHNKVTHQGALKSICLFWKASKYKIWYSWTEWDSLLSTEDSHMKISMEVTLKLGLCYRLNWFQSYVGLLLLISSNVSDKNSPNSLSKRRDTKLVHCLVHSGIEKSNMLCNHRTSWLVDASLCLHKAILGTGVPYGKTWTSSKTEAKEVPGIKVKYLFKMLSMDVESTYFCNLLIK